MESDLRETFRISSLGSPKMIQHVKDDPILQVSSQEASMSSKYWLWGQRGSWHTSIHSRELKFGTQVKNHILWQSMMSRMTPSSKYPVRNHQRPSSMTSRTGGSWHTSIYARELKFGTQVKNHISWRSIKSRMTPSSSYPVRNHLQSHRIWWSVLYWPWRRPWCLQAFPQSC